MRIGRKETRRYSSRRLHIRVYRARVRSQTVIYVWDVWINIGGDRIRGSVECFNMEEEDALDSKVRSFLYYLILVRRQRENLAVKEEG